jgi:hypothetical protein
MATMIMIAAPTPMMVMLLSGIGVAGCGDAACSMLNAVTACEG